MMLWNVEIRKRGFRNHLKRFSFFHSTIKPCDSWLEGRATSTRWPEMTRTRQGNATSHLLRKQKPYLLKTQAKNQESVISYWAAQSEHNNIIQNIISILLCVTASLDCNEHDRSRPPAQTSRWAISLSPIQHICMGWGHSILQQLHYWYGTGCLRFICGCI